MSRFGETIVGLFLTHLVYRWTPTYGRAKAGRPARTYIQQIFEDTGCSPEDLPEAMNDREKWREDQGYPCLWHEMMMMMMMIYIWIDKVWCKSLKSDLTIVFKDNFCMKTSAQLSNILFWGHIIWETKLMPVYNILSNKDVLHLICN